MFGRNKQDKQEKPGLVDRILAGIGADFADDGYEEDSAPRRTRRSSGAASSGDYITGTGVTVSWNRFSPEQLVTISIYTKDDDLLRRIVEDNAKEEVMVTGANIKGFNSCLIEAILFKQQVLPLDVFEEAVRAGKANSKDAEYVVVFADADGNPTTEEAPAAIAEEFADKMQYIRETRPDEFKQLDSETLLPEKPKMSKKFGKGGGPGKKSDKDEDKGEMSAIGKELLNFGELWDIFLKAAKDANFNQADAKNNAIKLLKIFNQTGGRDLWLTTKKEWDALMKRATDAEAKTKELEEERDKLKDRVKHQGEKIESLTKELEEAKKGGSGEPDPKPAEPDPKPKPAGGFAVAKTFIEMLEKKHGVKPENLPQRLRDADPEEKIPVAELLQLQKDAVAAQQAADDAAAHVVDDVDELADLLAKYGI